MDSLTIDFVDEKPRGLSIDFIDAPKPARGIGEAIQAGYQGSAAGLAIRGRLPEIQLDATNSAWYERLAAGATQIAAEFPLMVAGGMGGSAAGTAVAPGIGTVLGGGAGAFALPAAVRESYIQAYQKGEITGWGDFLDRTSIVLKKTGKEALIGAATAGAGKAAQVGAEAAGLGAKATMATVLTAEAGTLTVAPALLEGRAPEPQDFVDAAVLLVGLKGAGVASRKLMDVYAKTGKTPVEVMADAKNDPTIVQDLRAEPKAEPTTKAAETKLGEQLTLFPEVPRAYEKLARDENNRNAVPDPSPEAARFLEKPFADIPQLPGEPVLKTHVNYNYINAAQDAKSAMSRLSELYETQIKEATRGEVRWEQTYAEARELYRKTTGEEAPPVPLVNADYAKLSADLYARKQLLISGAEQLMTQRQAYVEARAKNEATDQMKLDLLAQIDRVAQAQAAVRGSQAEVGRALNILKSTNRDQAYYNELTSIIDGRFGVEGKAMGEAKFDTMVDMMGALGSPAQALKFAEKASKATTWEKFVEAWKAGLVSGPFTQIANILGNSTFMATRPIVDAVSVAFNAARGAPERMSAVEPLSRIVGNIHGVIDGSKAAFEVLRTGEAIGGKSEAHRKAIEGLPGEIVRVPFRLLSSADAFFRVTNERGEAYALASREAAKEGYNPATREFRERVAQLATNPTDKMIEAIDAAGSRFTFNAPLGEKGRALQSTIKALHLEWAVPFVQTPANVAKEMLRLTPAAPIIKEWRDAIKKGGPEADKAVAEMVIGTAVSTAVFSYAVSGMITGQGDPDPKKRAVQMASGWQPYSIKIGDTYYSYQRLQPVGTLFGMAADAATAWESMTPEESDKVPKIIATAFANAITNQTFLQGITNIVNAISDPQRFGPRFIQGLAGSLVPGIVAQPAAMLDPYLREVDSVLQAVQARIPVARESLFPKRDPFGEPIESKERVAAISPITTSTLSTDKVRTEAARLEVGVAKAPKYIELPAARDKKLGRVELTQEQQDIFATETGRLAHRILTPIVNAPTWDTTPDLVQRNAMAKVFEVARKYGESKAVTPEQIRSEAERIANELRLRLQPKPISE